MFLSFPSIGVFQSHPFTIASASEGDKKSKMVWIIRTRDGFTGRLKDFADVKKGLTTTPVFMDGPYGAPPDITPFSTCVFIAGEYTLALMYKRRELTAFVRWFWYYLYPASTS